MHVRKQVDGLENYLTDASNMAGGYAEKLFVPENADEVSLVLREANENSTPVTISGSRTGTVGGAVPFGGVVVSLERLNRILEIDAHKKTAIVEPGVLLVDFQKAVESKGLFYPPDPTEWSCQIGGTVATNASGARSFKYGATREFVRTLKIILPDGDILLLRRGENLTDAAGRLSLTTDGGRVISIPIPTYPRPDVRKNVSGYFNKAPLDAIDLFIGSEGTLGVIVEIGLTLLEKPAGFLSGIVFFPREENLLNFVSEARSRSFGTRENRGQNSGGSIDATLIEYFDANSLKFISEKFPETPSEMMGAIFFEQETSADSEDALFEEWNALLTKHDADIDQSWFTTSEQDREKMRAFRHALPVAVNERVVRNKQKKIGTDMAVPDEAFPSFLRFYSTSLQESGVDYVLFGHIGDCHLHANLLPKDESEAERSRHLYGRFIAQSIMLGGTVSAEHGIGKLKSKYLYVMMGERYVNEMCELKRAFDTKGILGRGNIFDTKFYD